MSRPSPKLEGHKHEVQGQDRDAHEKRDDRYLERRVQVGHPEQRREEHDTDTQDEGTGDLLASSAGDRLGPVNSLHALGERLVEPVSPAWLRMSRCCVLRRVRHVYRLRMVRVRRLVLSLASGGRALVSVAARAATPCTGP